MWALGTIAYELLTGRLPFAGEAMPQVCRAVLNDEPADPCTLQLEIPAELAAVVLRCLSKDPDLRYQNLAELASALAPFAPASGPLVARIAQTLRSAGTPESPGAERDARGAMRPDLGQVGAAAEPSAGSTLKSDTSAPQSAAPVRVDVVSAPGPAPSANLATAPTVLSDAQSSPDAAVAAAGLATAPTALSEEPRGRGTLPEAGAMATAPTALVAATSAPPMTPSAPPLTPYASPAAVPNQAAAPAAAPTPASGKPWLALLVIVPVALVVVLATLGIIAKRHRAASRPEPSSAAAPAAPTDEPSKPVRPAKPPELDDYSWGCCVNNAKKLAEPYETHLAWRFSPRPVRKLELTSMTFAIGDSTVVVADRNEKQQVPLAFDGRQMTEKPAVRLKAGSSTFPYATKHFEVADAISSGAHIQGARVGCACQISRMVLAHHSLCPTEEPCWQATGACKPRRGRWPRRCFAWCTVTCSADGACGRASCQPRKR